MAHPTNKYERREAGRRRLERLYDKSGNHCFSGVTFIIKNNDCGEGLYDKYDDCYGCNYRCILDRNKQKYVTWKRPVCTRYTIIRHYASSKITTYYKKVSNRKIRRTKEIYKRNQCHKLFDYWWTID